MDDVANLSIWATLNCNWNSISWSVPRYDESYYAIKDGRNEGRKVTKFGEILKKVKQNSFLKDILKPSRSQCAVSLQVGVSYSMPFPNIFLKRKTSFFFFFLAWAGKTYGLGQFFKIHNFLWISGDSLIGVFYSNVFMNCMKAWGR